MSTNPNANYNPTVQDLGNYTQLGSSYTTKSVMAPIPPSTITGTNLVPTFGSTVGYNSLKMSKGDWHGPYANFSEYPQVNWNFISRSCGSGRSN
jgi:hypothetical protein